MSVLHILETLGEFIIPICFAATCCIFVRTIWMNRGKGICWVYDAGDHASDVGEHASTNIDGTPMINASFDAMGNPYGSTNTHH